MVLVDGSARVGVQLAPDHVPPDWPHGTPQQIHLDLWVDDIGGAHEEVMSSGAKLLRAAADSDEPDNVPGVRRSSRPSRVPLLVEK